MTLEEAEAAISAALVQLRKDGFEIDGTKLQQLMRREMRAPTAEEIPGLLLELPPVHVEGAASRPPCAALARHPPMPGTSLMTPCRMHCWTCAVSSRDQRPAVSPLSTVTP